MAHLTPIAGHPERGQLQTGSDGEPWIHFSGIFLALLSFTLRWLPGTARVTNIPIHIQQERAPFLSSFLMAVSFILLVLIGPGLPISELATVEEDGIAMIGLENQPLELISISQNNWIWWSHHMFTISPLPGWSEN